MKDFENCLKQKKEERIKEIQSCYADFLKLYIFARDFQDLPVMEKFILLQCQEIPNSCMLEVDFKGKKNLKLFHVLFNFFLFLFLFFLKS